MHALLDAADFTLGSTHFRTACSEMREALINNDIVADADEITIEIKFSLSPKGGIIATAHCTANSTPPLTTPNYQFRLRGIPQ